MKVNDPIRAESRGKIVYFRAAKCHETRFASTTSLLRDISRGGLRMDPSGREMVRIRDVGATFMPTIRSFNTSHHICICLSFLLWGVIIYFPINEHITSLSRVWSLISWQLWLHIFFFFFDKFDEKIYLHLETVFRVMMWWCKIIIYYERITIILNFGKF